MGEHDGTVQMQSTPPDLKRGIWMFKDHVATMKSGSRLLGGEEQEVGEAEEHGRESE